MPTRVCASCGRLWSSAVRRRFGERCPECEADAAGALRACRGASGSRRRPSCSPVRPGATRRAARRARVILRIRPPATRSTVGHDVARAPRRAPRPGAGAAHAWQTPPLSRLRRSVRACLVSASTASSAASTWSAASRRALWPMRPSRQMSGASGPSPPPISTSCSLRTRPWTSLPSTPSGTRTAVSWASWYSGSASSSRPRLAELILEVGAGVRRGAGSDSRGPPRGRRAAPRAARRCGGSARCGGR